MLPPQSPVSGCLRASGSVPRPRGRALTERCWNNQALMMLVATLGKMPLFLFRLRSGSSSSSSPPELGEAMLVSSPSPEGGGVCCACGLEGAKPEAQNPHPRHPPPPPRPPWQSHVLSNFSPQAGSSFPFYLPPLPLSSFSPGSLELSPLWEARPPLDGPGVPRCTDPLSSWSLSQELFWERGVGSHCTVAKTTGSGAGASGWQACPCLSPWLHDLGQIPSPPRASVSPTG